MARKVRIVNCRDFVCAKPDGLLNLEESEQLLRDVVKASDPLEAFDILVDTRDAESVLSATDPTSASTTPPSSRSARRTRGSTCRRSRPTKRP